MIRSARSFMRRFRRGEDGSALVIEFVIFTPLLFGAFLMAVEMGGHGGAVDAEVERVRALAQRGVVAGAQLRVG